MCYVKRDPILEENGDFFWISYIQDADRLTQDAIKESFSSQQGREAKLVTGNQLNGSHARTQ